MISSNGRVLIVDDDRPLVVMITTILEDEGYAVQTAFNGEEGLNMAKESPPDLILMDLRMPIMDGWTCCRLLREREETQRIPVVVMSGDGAREAVQAELGIRDFLKKPFEMDDLLLHVRKLATPAGRDS
ncbi:MAG: response regulator [Chloroflexi bacterium]|nr:response regulator [Chloroflexota bacterium]